MPGILTLLLAACQGGGRERGTPREDLLGELNRKAGILTQDTIHVASAVSPEDRYGGIKIDARHYEILRKQYDEGKVGGFYVSYRMELEPGYTGYLLRVPSRYTSSGIDLWVYEEDSGSWTAPFRVADAFGGGSWQYAMDGWLVDIDGDRHRDLVNRRRYWWTDEALKEQQADSLFVRLWRRATFTEPRLSHDTALSAIFLPDRWRR